MRAEQALSAFLDEFFYQRLLDEGRFSSFLRITDKETQLKGIDVIGCSGISEAYIDEKAQLHYINKHLPTFAFELSFLSGEKECIGWFLNDELKTTHYLLLWPNARTTSLERVKQSDFTHVEAMMISKSNLKKYLFDLGLEYHVLTRINTILRNKNRVGPQGTAYDGIKFYVSPPDILPENPINIVINRKHLEKVPGAITYWISKDKFIRRNSLCHLHDY